jgi:hypothetical protein
VLAVWVIVLVEAVKGRDGVHDFGLALFSKRKHARSYQQNAAAHGLAEAVVEFTYGGDVDDIVHD